MACSCDGSNARPCHEKRRHTSLSSAIHRKFTAVGPYSGLGPNASLSIYYRLQDLQNVNFYPLS